MYLYGLLIEPSLPAVTQLLLDGDAEIINDIADIPLASSSTVIILCDPLQTNFERDATIIRRYAIVQSSWILDSCSAGEILPFAPYAPL